MKQIVISSLSLIHILQYLLNKDVLCKQVVSMLYALTWDPVPTVDDLFAWENRFAWGEENVRRVYGRPDPVGVMMTENIFDQEMQANLDVLIPYVEAHPDTEFYFFIPPYSILFWDQTIDVYKRQDVGRARQAVVAVHALAPQGKLGCGSQQGGIIPLLLGSLFIGTGFLHLLRRADSHQHTAHSRPVRSVCLLYTS